MEIFIKLSKVIYLNKFDYKNVKYVSNNHRINIKCDACDVSFDILPNDHFTQRNGGCTECSKKCKDDADFEEIRNVNVEKYKDRYLISSKGRCFSKITGIELTPSQSEYERVHLTANKIAKQPLIHILVYRSFNDDYTDELDVDHIDGVKNNNDVKNLRLRTRSENMKNAYKNNINMHRDRPVSAYDKDGTFVKSFKNTDEARKYIGHKSTIPINMCLHGKRKTAGNFIWKYSDDKMIEINKAKFVDDTEDYVSLGKIDDYDFSKYYINKEGIIVNTNFKNRKITPFMHDGYLSVHLCRNNKQKVYQLHRLIAKVYLENGEFYFNNGKYVVNHINKKLDNTISNLEWTTQKENVIHGRGKKVAKIDIKTDAILETYITVAEAAKSLNKTTSGNISQVCNGKLKKAYGFKWKFIDE